MEQGTALLLANAIIWAAVLVGVSVVQDGTGSSQVTLVVAGGDAASIVILGGGISRLIE